MQSKVGFVDQRRSLQRARRDSPSQLLASDSSKFFVNQRYQCSQRIPISLSPQGKEYFNFGRIGLWHRPLKTDWSRELELLRGAIERHRSVADMIFPKLSIL